MGLNKLKRLIDTKKREAFLLLSTVSWMGCLCVFLVSSAYCAPGDILISENIPPGVSQELFGKIYASKNLVASDFILSGYRATATFSTTELPIIITRTAGVQADTATVTLKFKAGAMDLSPYNGVHFVIENLSSEQVTFNILPNAGDVRGFWSEFIIPSKSNQIHFLTTLDEDNIYLCSDQNGMQRCPIGPNQLPAVVQAKSKTMDLKKVTHYEIRLVNVPLGAQLKIHQMKAVKIGYRPEDIPGLIDKYGQNRWVKFDGKVMSDQDLRDDAAKESPTIRPLPVRWDMYGGDNTAGGYTATGYFRVEKVGDKWWIVSPLGNLTYLSGLSWVYHRTHETNTRNREILFHQLPPKTGSTATLWTQRQCVANNNNVEGVGEFCGGPHWMPYLHNIFIKYQDPAKSFNEKDVLKRWGITTQNRMNEWGFNFVDSIAVPSYFKYPYVMNLLVNNQAKKIPGTLLPDVYDVLFKDSAQAYVKKFIADRKITGTSTSIKFDPYLVGFFSDNELDFGHTGDFANHAEVYYLIIQTLKQNDTVPSKKAFTDQLKIAYGDVSKLKTAWAKSLDGVLTWDDFLKQSVNITAPFNAVLVADLSKLLTLYSEKYYSTMKEIIRIEAPNHLYLGSRFAGFHRAPREAIDMCVKHCDVYTVNYYKPQLLEKDWGYLLTKDKPILITEYHFGAPTHGGSWGGHNWYTNQQDRRDAYMSFVKELQLVPQIVGNTYQPYVNRPLSAVNFEAQNSFVGFLTTADRPYQEMVEAAKLVNHSVYDVRKSLPKGGVTPDPQQLGDVSLNGRVTLYDVSLILRYLSGYQLSQQQLLKADVDLNSIINGADAESVKQKAFYGIEYSGVR